MPTHYSDRLLTCDGCGATRESPASKVGGLEGRAARQTFMESGWRTVSNPYEHPVRLLPRTRLVSCPNCPPVQAGDPAGVYRTADSQATRPRFGNADPVAADVRDDAL